ncbi:Integrin alpha beta-propellor repeat protein [Gloeothece citriformis PCC 7424]|uniref:Integrin alpha beta-propellor repeat protein n=1 Tax=Gloeothece citriformis (strain PCC 7424) TaxID=65393 RepID=B7KJ67_GLOC7|nr:hypothetical protein [Gloeothece citriformis]ACK72151.1 Integrin alpha beta-propellor repeat protein [Gloeothece citriformis PCC 7424]
MTILHDPNNATLDYNGANQLAFMPAQLTTQNSQAWQLTQTFVNPTPATGDQFGFSVSISDNNVLIGAFGDGGQTGAAYLYDGETGQLRQTFTPQGDDIFRFGYSVAVGGNNVVIGAPGDLGTRLTEYVYLYDGVTGQLLENFSYSTSNSFINTAEFGEAVDISDNQIVAGAPLDRSEGAAYLLDVDGTVIRDLFEPPGNPPFDSFPYFGESVAISGNNVIVGAPNTGTIEGEAYLFNAATGQVLQNFVNPYPQNFARFGDSVAISGNNVLIGAPEQSSGEIINFAGMALEISGGAAYLFNGQTGQLIQGFANPNTNRGNDFGFSVAIDGNNVLIGAVNGAYLYDGPTGQLLQTFTPSSTGASHSVAISGNNILIGVAGDDAGATDSGAVYLYELVTGQNPPNPEVNPPNPEVNPPNPEVNPPNLEVNPPNPEVNPPNPEVNSPNPDFLSALEAPVYRFFNTIAGGHFFTTSPTERDTVLNTLPQYVYEGVGFRASQVGGDNLFPVYRFYNTVAGGHFFTLNEQERDTVINTFPQYVYEGIGFYAYGADSNLGQDSYRFYNTVAGGHFFTLNEQERNTVINLPQYVYEQVGFEAAP